MKEKVLAIFPDAEVKTAKKKRGLEYLPPRYGIVTQGKFVLADGVTESDAWDAAYMRVREGNAMDGFVIDKNATAEDCVKKDFLPCDRVYSALQNGTFFFTSEDAYRAVNAWFRGGIFNNVRIKDIENLPMISGGAFSFVEC